MRDAQITLPALLQSLKKYKIGSVLTFLVLMTLVVVVFIIFPRAYGSEGKLFVQLGRESVSLDPTATTTNATIALNESRETEIRSIVELLQSRDLHEKVVDKVGLKKVLKEPIEIPFADSVTEFVGSLAAKGEPDSDYERQKEFDQAVRKLAEAIKIESTKKTTVISVYTKAMTPELAKEITDTLMKEYQQKHMKVNRRDQSLEFFNREFQLQEQVVKQKISELEKFRNDKKILSVVGARNLLQSKLDKLEISLMDTQTSQATNSAKVRALAKSLETLPDKIDAKSTSGIGLRSTNLMRATLYELEIEERKLSQELDAEHPKLVGLRTAIERAEGDLAAQPTDETQNTTEANPTYLKINEIYLTELANESGLEKREASLVSKIESARKSLEELNASESTVDQLTRDIAIEKGTLDKLAAKRSEARVLGDLDSAQISNVKIAQAGSLQVKHVSPRGSIFLPLGFMFSIFGACVYALRRSATAPNYIRASEIEELTQIPVVIEIPRSSPSNVMLTS